MDPVDPVDLEDLDDLEAYLHMGQGPEDHCHRTAEDFDTHCKEDFEEVHTA